MTFHRPLMIAAGLLGFTAVLAGTFGAHGLESLPLDPDAPGWWSTASHYHLAHAVLLPALSLWASRGDRTRRGVAAGGWCVVGGVVIFAGSLYVMSLTGLRWLGAVTPIGGLGMLAGWALVTIAAWRDQAR